MVEIGDSTLNVNRCFLGISIFRYNWCYLFYCNNQHSFLSLFSTNFKFELEILIRDRNRTWYRGKVELLASIFSIRRVNFKLFERYICVCSVYHIESNKNKIASKEESFLEEEVEFHKMLLLIVCNMRNIEFCCCFLIEMFLLSM